MSRRRGRLPKTILIGRVVYRRSKQFSNPFTGKEAQLIATGLELLKSSGLVTDTVLHGMVDELWDEFTNNYPKPNPLEEYTHVPK